jgi:putative ABC transport system permease protein
MRQLLRRAWHALRTRRFEADLAEELALHRELKQRELEARGANPMEAAFAARRALGSVALAQDRSRDVWCPRAFQGVGQDVRLAVRSLRRTPVVTAVAVLSLALGIGANTAIFSIVNSLLLRTLPVANPQQLAMLTTPRIMRLGSSGAGWSYAVWEELQRRSAAFDGEAAWSSQQVNLASAGQTDFATALIANGSYFDTLGVHAALGRTFADSDDQRNGGPSGPVVVLGYAFWQRQFGGAADVIGRALTIERVPFTIVGVTAPGFFGTDVGRAFDVAFPIGDEPLIRPGASRLDQRNLFWLNVIVRLKAGQTLEAARTLLRQIEPQIRAAAMPDMPAQYRDQWLTGPEGFAMVPAAAGNSFLRDRYSRPLWAILVVVLAVQLIACANIANLLFARATARWHELSVRTALGASRWRLARQMLTESAALAAAGTLIGVLVASWAGQFIVQQISTRTNTVALDVSMDGGVLLFTIGVGVATMLLFGVGPAFHHSRIAPIGALREHVGWTADAARAGLGNGLVVAQVALSITLLVAAGLFVRSFASLATRDLGFAPDRVLLVNINTLPAAVAPSERLPLYERTVEAIRTVPGVADAALSDVTPVSGGVSLVNLAVSDGQAVPMTLLGGMANGFANGISPGWFRTVGMRLVGGRDFTDRDRTGASPVAIVNQALAHAFLGGANPIGHTITLNLTGEPRREIVGVVTDAVYGSLREVPPPTVYVPFAQPDREGPAFINANVSVRSAGGDAGLLTKPVLDAVATVNPDVALTFRTLSDQLNASLVQERLVAMLSAFFSGIGLLLAGLGLYGVTAYAVTRRRREIGIRMALGAAPGGVVRLVLSRLFIQIALGMVIGGVMSLWVSKFVTSLLYGLGPRDPATIAGAAVILAAVGGAAAWLPARRASRIDPSEVLREG